MPDDRLATLERVAELAAASTIGTILEHDTAASPRAVALFFETARAAEAFLAAITEAIALPPSDAGASSDLSQQLIDGARRYGVDTYTKTLLWHASSLIDQQAAAIPPSDASGWRDIASAPRVEGPRYNLMLWWPHWRTDRPVFGHWTAFHGGWRADEALSADGVGPTHWRPLPTPPEETR